MKLSQAILQRRSIRRFLNKKIPDTLLNQILIAGTWAPSNCNLQDWDFVLIKNKQLKQRLVKQAGVNLRITKAPITLVACYGSFDPQVGIQSVSAAIQNMLLTATSLGIGSCWMASCGNRDKVKQILNIPQEKNIASMVVFGYPAYQVNNPPPRKPIKQVTHANKFTHKAKSTFLLNPDSWTLKEISRYQYYYCRKTALGVPMDIFSSHESQLVNQMIKSSHGQILDLLTYDASFINLYKHHTFTLDLNQQTSAYTQAAAKHHGKKIKALIYKNKIPLKKDSINTVTSFFNLERIPSKSYSLIFNQVYKTLKSNGKFVMVFRNSSSLYSLIYKLIKLKFGSDTRDSAIYSFFGPYQPVDSAKILQSLKNQGFKVNHQKLFFIPPQLESIYQLYLQYKVSAGTTFLSRIKRQNSISKFLHKLIGLKIFKSSSFGSISLIEAHKPSA